MIGNLRQRHRIMVGVLAVIVPVVFIAGVLNRKPTPVQVSLPEVLSTSTADYTYDLTGDYSIEVSDTILLGRLVAKDVQRTGGVAVTFFTEQPDAAWPDTLVLWAAGVPTDQDGIPEGAYVLGILTGGTSGPHILPHVAVDAGGYILFYSVAHQALLPGAWTLPWADAKGVGDES